jgi:hypothetical protein
MRVLAVRVFLVSEWDRIVSEVFAARLARGGTKEWVRGVDRTYGIQDITLAGSRDKFYRFIATVDYYYENYVGLL